MRTRFLILIFCLAFVTGTAAAQITSQRFAAITVENASDLRIVKEAPAPPGIGEVRVSSQIALSPNAELAAFWTTIPGSSTETVGGLLIWELVSDDTNSYPFNDGDSVTVIGFLDNDRLAYILNSASYHVLRLSTGELELSTPLPDGAYGVNEGILHREAGIAAFPITNTEVCLLDVDNGRCRIVYTEPDVLSLYSLALSADGAYLAAGDGDEFGELGAMTVSEDERLIVTLSFDELMRVFAVPA